MKKRLWLWTVDVAKMKKTTDNPYFDDDAPSVTCLFKIRVADDVLTSGTPFYVSLIFFISDINFETCFSHVPTELLSASLIIRGSGVVDTMENSFNF